MGNSTTGMNGFGYQPAPPYSSVEMENPGKISKRARVYQKDNIPIDHEESTYKSVKNIENLIKQQVKLNELKDYQAKLEAKQRKERETEVALAKKVLSFNKGLLKDKIELLKTEDEEYEVLEKIEKNEKKRDEFRKKRKQNQELLNRLQQEEEKRAENQAKIADRIETKNKRILNAKEKLRAVNKDIEKLDKQHADDLVTIFELEKKQKNQTLNADEQQILRDARRREESYESNLANNDSLKEKLEKIINNREELNAVVKSISSTVTSILGSIKGNIQSGIDAAALGTGKINTRLYGIESKGGSMFEDYKNTVQSFTLSYAVSAPKYMENLLTTIDQGIAVDVESKALLATLGDRMVSTYNVLDEHLTKLIRLQQSDLSYAQLGSEARLTSLLNSVFGNTQYLGTSGGQGLYDTVASMLVDATASMSGEAVVAFEYAVQKWMGSLYAVGLSDEAVQNIVGGIVSLATGNVSNLNQNDSLRNLLALSASNAGLSYSEMLTNGLDASNVNSLLESMVNYLAGIYKSTTNQVTKSAWGNIVGLGLSDLRAISNLTSSDIASISGSNINYGSAISEANSAFTAAISGERLGVAGRVDTLLENMMYAAGLDIGSNTTRYIAYKLGSIITDLGRVMNGQIGEIVTMVGLAGNIASIVEAGVNALGNTAIGANLEDLNMFNAGEKIGNLNKDLLSLLSGMVGGSDLTVIKEQSGNSLLEKYISYSNIVNKRGILYNAITPTTYTSEGSAIVGLSAAAKVDAQIDKKLAEVEAASDKTSKSLESIVDNSERIQSQAKTVVDSSSATVYDVSSLYDALFVNQISMKVKLADYDDVALQKLADIFSAPALADALNKVTKGSIDVDIVDDDTQNIVDTIMKVRGF